MSDPPSSDGVSRGPHALEFEAPDASFRLVVGVYVGTLLAAVAITAAAVGGAPTVVLLGTSGSAFAIGVLVGWPLAEPLSAPIVRLGRTRPRRLAFALPSVPFGAVALVASVTPAFGSGVGTAALASAFGAGVSGYALSQVAENRYVDAITGDEPVAAWRWEPPDSSAADLVFVVLSAVLGLGNAADGNGIVAVLWTGAALFWVVGAVLEGRWKLRESGVRPEIRLHEAGLVKRRPNARTLVPWSEITGVRLIAEELVIERRLLDLRFDRDELEDPDAVRDEIDRVRSSDVHRAETRGGATAG